MFRGKGTGTAVKENVSAVGALAAELAADRKFRKQLVSALGHGFAAQQRARRQVGALAAVRGLASDEQLRDELRQMTEELGAMKTRFEKKRTHRLRNLLLILLGAGGATVAAMPMRRWIESRMRSSEAASGGTPRTIQAEVEVEVPVSTAYNQWTQFEEFPKFMEGVEEVRQLDDTRLHWVANIAGKRGEWDAKILEQHPDEQISWASENGKKTRGTVSFESRGPSRTLVTLSMSYQAQGLREAVGSAVGLDRRRVRQDLQRFKELLESRGGETGAWRGDISEGTPSRGKRGNTQ
jgi:uncharacterized membrane protein